MNAESGDARVYGSSRIKRPRRSQAQMSDLIDAVRDEINQVEGRMTIRHMFYRLSGKGIIDKTERAYQNLCAHLATWRKAGEIPFGAFVDGTRWYYGDSGFNSLDDALEDCAGSYRKNYWRDAGVHVEVWTEKETVASMLTSAARPFGVQVFVCRGFASLSSLYDAAELFKRHADEGKDIRVLYFGDHDPSGLRIDQSAEDTIRNTFNVPVQFERVAVTPEQIERYQLPTRPTKTKSSHALGFVGESVEIDAMEPTTIKQLVQESIEQFIEPHTLEVLRVAEREERAKIYELADLLRATG